MNFKNFKNELSNIFNRSNRILLKVDVKVNQELDNLENLSIDKKMESLKLLLDTSLEQIDCDIENVS
jgi:hypothetical protein